MAMNREGERCDGDGMHVQASRWIKAPGGSDILSQFALLKLDTYNATDTAKATYTLWVDSAGDLRILKGHPTTANLAGASTACGTVVGTQT